MEERTAFAKTSASLLIDENASCAHDRQACEVTRLRSYLHRIAEEFLDRTASDDLLGVLSDVRMPGMRASELQAHLHRRRYRVAVHFLHGLPRRAHSWRNRSGAGAICYLTQTLPLGQPYPRSPGRPEEA